MKRSTLLAAAALSITSGLALGDGYGPDDKPDHITVICDDVADAGGMMLFIFGNGTWEKSNGYDGCAADWRPFPARKDAVAYGHVTVMKRTDNSCQGAWQGRPLDHWNGDKMPDDTNGDGVGGLWYVVFH